MYYCCQPTETKINVQVATSSICFSGAKVIVDAKYNINGREGYLHPWATNHWSDIFHPHHRGGWV